MYLHYWSDSNSGKLCSLMEFILSLFIKLRQQESLESVQLNSCFFAQRGRLIELRIVTVCDMIKDGSDVEFCCFQTRRTFVSCHVTSWGNGTSNRGFGHLSRHLRPVVFISFFLHLLGDWNPLSLFHLPYALAYSLDTMNVR